MTEPKCFTSKDGTKEWWVDGKLHRLNGPAVEWADSSKEWYANGKRHRLVGPACEYADGVNFWYIDGKRVSEQDFPKAVVMFLFGCNEQSAQLIIDLFKSPV